MNKHFQEDIFIRVEKAANEKIGIMREAAKEMFGERLDLIIGINGSIARREYTSGSDVDLFFVATTGCCECLKEEQDSFEKILLEHNFKMPSKDGVFSTPQKSIELLEPIGGDDDTNFMITRRMLYLLEGEWVFNENGFSDLRKQLIERYVPKEIENEKLCLYLLNDIIRYWRTICIDFEHKTSGGDKPRAIRLAKLRISRMLLYFAGVLAVRQAVDMPREAKCEKLISLFSIPPIQRLKEILDKEFCSAQKIYGEFLIHLDDPRFREALQGAEGLETDEFIKMTNLARNFKSELLKILERSSQPNEKLVSALLL